jgi:integrase
MKNRTGSLLLRNKRYYSKIKIDGTVIVRALSNPDNTPCRTLVEARRAQALATREIALVNRKQALEAAIRQLADVDSELDAIQAPKVKLADSWERYLSNSERPNSGHYTLKAYCQYTRQFVEWTVKRYPRSVHLADVSKTAASDYSKHLSGMYSGTTYNKHLSFLRLLWRVLVEGKQNPFDRIRLKTKDSTSHEALTQEQLQSVLQRATGELNTFILVGIYTSLRRKDACLLKWSQVDLDNNTITVTPSKTASRSHKVVCLPIHPVLKARLETTFRKDDYVMPRMAFWYDHNPAHISRRIKDLFEACGIKTQFEIENKQGSLRRNKAVFSFHSLRFTMGQQLISNGYSLDMIAQVLGHTSTAMARYYSTVSDGVKAQAILSLPNIATA